MNKATTDFIEELQTDPNVVGVVLFGSWARGNNRDDSDVDLLVLLQQGYKRAVQESDGQVFEIIYTTPDAALKYYTDHRDDAFGLWSVAKVMYSKEKTVENLQQEVKDILKDGKAPIPDSQREQIYFDKKDKLKYIKNIYEADKTTANLMLFNTVSELTEVFFDLRQQWTPAPKQRLKYIEEGSSDFGVLLREFYSDETPTERRWALLEQMTTLVFD